VTSTLGVPESRLGGSSSPPSLSSIPVKFAEARVAETALSSKSFCYIRLVKAELSLINCCQPLVRPRLTERQALDLEAVFKALADQHRLKMLNMLTQADGQAICVCDFQEALGLKQTTASYHLRQLADAGIVDRERRGTYAYYRLRDGALDQIAGLLRRRSPTAAT
jgi:ArsR family transcriptional regulator